MSRFERFNAFKGVSGFGDELVVQLKETFYLVCSLDLFFFF